MKGTAQIETQIREISRKILVSSNSQISGLTIDLEGKIKHTNKGYFVSLKSPSVKMNLQKFNGLKVDQVSELIKKLYFKSSSLDYIGYWVDQNTIYIDISRHFDNVYQAITFGILNQQKAIFDCENQNCINL